MDIISAATLWYFAAIAAGGLLGAVVGYLTRFELGLGAGLLLPGLVAMWFVGRCVVDYRAFTRAGPLAATGEVLEVQDRPSNAAGTITHPVPVVRFRAPDGSTHVLDGPSSGSLGPGDLVSVIYDAADPRRSRIGQPHELRNGAIAFTLFGTFPLSVGSWFLFAYSRVGEAARGGARAPAISQRRRLLLDRSLLGLNLAAFAAFVVPLLWPAPVHAQLRLAFGGLAVVLVGHAMRAAFDPAMGARGSLALGVLGVNFAVWAAALYLLLP